MKLANSLGLALLLAACAAPASETSSDSTSDLSKDEELVPSLGGGKPISDATEVFAGAGDYQLGDEWGKKPVTAATLAGGSEAYRRGARATAKYGGATSFYLGKFGGAHVMATNYHVQSSTNCTGRTATFPHLDGVSVTCKRVFGTWNNIDLALFEVTVRPADEAKLASVGSNFAFYDEITKGTELLTVGFGIASNASRSMVANQDTDCRVFSKSADYRFLADPDDVNPGGYKAWSFSHGCDVSHGDSGSAILDRATGKPLGIVWTGRIPKAPRVQSSSYLAEVFATDGADVWTELSYAVPATKMREHLASVIASTATPESTRAVLSDLIRR